MLHEFRISDPKLSVGVCIHHILARYGHIINSFVYFVLVEGLLMITSLGGSGPWKSRLESKCKRWQMQVEDMVFKTQSEQPDSASQPSWVGYWVRRVIWVRLSTWVKLDQVRGLAHLASWFEFQVFELWWKIMKMIRPKIFGWAALGWKRPTKRRGENEKEEMTWPMVYIYYTCMDHLVSEP